VADRCPRIVEADHGSQDVAAMVGVDSLYCYRIDGRRPGELNASSVQSLGQRRAAAP
jgi:hypothetical protein